MKRIVTPALVALCLLFMPAKEQSLAQEVTPPLNLTELQWKLLQPTVAKTDLGGDLPEVATLTLSNDQFAANINHNKATALKYLNDQKIFKKTLIKVIFCNVTPNKDGAYWILIIPHTFQSTACIVAWQVPKTGTSK